jgi:hypothetical protein
MRLVGLGVLIALVTSLQAGCHSCQKRSSSRECCRLSSTVAEDAGPSTGIMQNSQLSASRAVSIERQTACGWDAEIIRTGGSDASGMERAQEGPALRTNRPGS